MGKIANYLQATILTLIIFTSGVLMLNAAWGDSAIFGETARVVAGYNYLKNADEIIFTARLVPIFLTLLAIFFIYYFAKEIMGRWWALLPAFLFAFSPMVLAHGHYVTTDIAATLGALLTIFYFVRLLDDYNPRNLLIASAAFGLAQAVKFSSVLLIPALILMAVIYSLINYQNRAKALYRNCKAAFFTIIIGYAIVVFPLYLSAGWNYPIEKQGEYLSGVLTLFQPPINGNNADFYHFPLIYLMKESLPAIVLIFIGFLLGLVGIVKSLKKGFSAAEKLKEYLNIRFLEFSMILFIIIYWLSSVLSPLNIGVRHFLPIIPFIYILSASAVKKWFSSEPREIATDWLEQIENTWHFIFNFWLKTSLLSILIIWVVLETALASPYFLSYYNEFFGWRTNGFYYAADSDFDLGQDLKRLKSWTDANLEKDEKLAVDYFGGGDVKYYFGDQAEIWQSAKGNPKDEGISWLAISANILMKALADPAPGFYKNPADEYRWLENPYGFIDRAGTSIFIYRLQ